MTGHEIQVVTRGIAYGGVDVYLRCTAKDCDWFHAVDDTSCPMLEDLVRAAAAHDTQAVAS